MHLRFCGWLTGHPNEGNIRCRALKFDEGVLEVLASPLLPAILCLCIGRKSANIKVRASNPVENKGFIGEDDEGILPVGADCPEASCHVLRPTQTGAQLLASLVSCEKVPGAF